MNLFGILMIGCGAAYFAASLLSGWRLKVLKARGALAPDLAAYFAPLTDNPLIRFSVGWESRASMQTDRTQGGRMIKLLIGREHLQIGDRWLTLLVYAQRLIVAAAAAVIAAQATHLLPY